MVQIRRAVETDAEVISEVLLESFSTFREHYTPEAFEIVTPSAELIRERFAEGPMWIGIIDETIVGTASAMPEPDWLYVRSIAVLPSARGMGIAGKLLDAIEEYAVSEGFEKLFLYTTYFTTGAVELYEKHGYLRGRDTTADEWYGTPGLEMEKKIGRTHKG
ncbi:MAG TPA: GNAT family N-acetyltransferase [Pyrinomonadaceae bacterium]|nr:GNAT family N-acetyltransferase [Pyrinomonadaceae bacterium]